MGFIIFHFVGPDFYQTYTKYSFVFNVQLLLSKYADKDLDVYTWYTKLAAL